jgi:hypothetical protein
MNSNIFVKFIDINMCQPEHTFERAGLQFLMVRDHCTYFSLGVISGRRT